MQRDTLVKVKCLPSPQNQKNNVCKLLLYFCNLFSSKSSKIPDRRYHPSINAAQCWLTSVKGGGEAFFQVRSGGGEGILKVNRGGREGFFKLEIECPDQKILSTIAWPLSQKMIQDYLEGMGGLNPPKRMI